jgi:hypothetical protein
MKWETFLAINGGDANSIDTHTQYLQAGVGFSGPTVYQQQQYDIQLIVDRLLTLWKLNKHDPRIAEARQIYKNIKPLFFTSADSKEYVKRKALYSLAKKIYREEAAEKARQLLLNA